MKKLISWFKDKFTKPNLVKCEKILSNLNMDTFSGMIGKEISYLDKITKLPIINIVLTKNDIIFNLADKPEYFNNIGLIDLNKKERIYLYHKIEKYMVTQQKEYITAIKRAFLSRIGLNESEFAFLVTQCQETEI